MKERFNKQFVDEDTGLLNIGKYDYDRVMEFIEGEMKIRDEKIKQGLIEYAFEFIEAQHFNREWFIANVKNYFKNHNDETS